MNNLSLLLGYLLIAFGITLVLIPYYIRFLYHFRLGKTIRDEALVWKATEFAKLHKEKTGTPTLGWGVILLVIFLLVLGSIGILWMSGWIENIFGITLRHSLWSREETYLPLFTLATVWLIGLIDDYMNVRGIGRTKWLSARVKMILLILFAGIGAFWFYFKLWYTSVHIPFFWQFPLEYLYIPLFILIVVAMANSVNITDWLDGLAGWLLLFNYTVYAFLTYQRGLFILSALCLIIVGTLIAFLWFNIKPAKFYMGDIGSLSLWATLAVMAMLTDTLWVLLITGSLFILETLSVIIQITSKKLRNGKKVFRIAPFHHHLEAIGWSEETIVMRFWLIGMVLASIGIIVGLGIIKNVIIF